METNTKIPEFRFKEFYIEWKKKDVIMLCGPLSENKKPRLKNRVLFATPTAQAVLSHPAFSLSALLGGAKVHVIH